MRDLMNEYALFKADRVSSFGLESLIWNLADSNFTEYPTVMWYVFKKIVNGLYNNTAVLKTYYEANGIKPLCPDSKTTTAYTEFINALYSFYDYEVN